MANRVELVVAGSNQTQGALDAANREVQRFSNDIERGFRRGQQSAEQFTSSFSQMSRVTRVVAGDVATQLNPALGDAVGALGAAAGAARGMSLAAGGVTVGLALAGVGLSQYIQGLNAAAERQGALNLAVKSFDAAAIRTQMQQISGELETAAARRQGGFLDQTIQGFKDLAQAMGFTASSTMELGRARAGLDRVLPLERELALSQLFSKQDAALQGLNQAFAARASFEKDEAAFIVQHEKMVDALTREANEAERAFEAQADLETARIRARGGSAAEIELVNKLLKEQLELLGTQTIARFEVNRLAKEQGILDIRSRRLPAIQADLQPAEGVAPTAAELNALAEISVRTQQRMLAGALEINQAEQERLDVLTTVQGLSLSEQENLDKVLGAERERLRVLQAQLELQRLQADPATSPAALQAAQLRVSNAEQQAAINAANRERSQLERTDFGAGAQKGLRDILEDFRSEGRAGEGLVRDLASGMHQTFTDLLFLPLEQDWKKALVDVPKQLVGTLLRPIIDFAAKQLTGSLIESVSKAFPALGLAGTMVMGTGAVPGSAAAEQVLAATAGQRTEYVTAATGGTVIPPSSSSVVDVLGFLRGSQTPVLVTPGGQVQTLPSVTTGAEGFLAAESAGTLARQPALGTSGLGLGQAVGGLAGIASLAGLAYSNLQAAPMQNNEVAIVGSAVTGAISGAIAGSIIYPGVGTFIGAVAGAFLGAGTAAAPKGTDPEVARDRQQGRQREAQNIYDQMTRAISGAGSIEQALNTPIMQFPPGRPTTFAPRSAGPGLPPGVPAPPPNFQGPPPFDQSGGG